MATINGTKSVFLTPETPAKVETAITAETTDYQTYIENQVNFASELATDEVDFDDPEFQAEYQEWLDWVDSQRDWDKDLEDMARQHEREEAERTAAELETAEHEAYEAHLEAQAEAYHNARHGDVIGLNTNHDAIWQAGGSV